MTDHCISWDDVPEQVSASGVAKRVLSGADVSLVMVKVPAGIKADRHSHAHEQFVQVVSGAGMLETEQGSRRFGPGSVFHFPRDTWHAAQFDVDTVLVETNLMEQGRGT
ncbi:quercetin dioxygenase-like cupin family protein [Skermanella aerolata]|jgi:quercetin dioxygenase-like cupin family protein|uniref:cupin domain-containing protein n=1 Tax=Skermanella aerolata TaxID=393310 RepID=UPI003D198F39